MMVLHIPLRLDGHPCPINLSIQGAFDCGIRKEAEPHGLTRLAPTCSIKTGPNESWAESV